MRLGLDVALFADAAPGRSLLRDRVDACEYAEAQTVATRFLEKLE